METRLSYRPKKTSWDPKLLLTRRMPKTLQLTMRRRWKSRGLAQKTRKEPSKDWWSSTISRSVRTSSWRKSLSRPNWQCNPSYPRWDSWSTKESSNPHRAPGSKLESDSLEAGTCHSQIEPITLEGAVARAQAGQPAYFENIIDNNNNN